jgi:hypothetical protein
MELLTLGAQLKALVGRLVQQHGCVVVDDVINPENFGNAYVLLRCAEVRLLLVRDRDQLFARIAYKDGPEEWFGLSMLLEYLQASPPRAVDYFTPAELEQLLPTHFARICDLFDATHRTESLEAMRRFKKIRSRERWAKRGVLHKIEKTGQS